MDEDKDCVKCGNCARRTVPDTFGSCPHCAATLICSWCNEPFTGSDMRAVVRMETPAGTATVEVHMPACRDDIVAVRAAVAAEAARDAAGSSDSGDAQPDPDMDAAAGPEPAPELAPAVADFLRSLGAL